MGGVCGKFARGLHCCAPQQRLAKKMTQKRTTASSVLQRLALAVRLGQNSCSAVLLSGATISRCSDRSLTNDMLASLIAALLASAVRRARSCGRQPLQHAENHSNASAERALGSSLECAQRA